MRFKLLNGIFCGAEMILADDKRYLIGKSGQEQRFFNCRITAANNEDVLSSIKHSVTGSAVRNTVPRKPLFSFKTGVARCCTSGNDNRAGFVGYLRSDNFKQTRSTVMLESYHVAHYHLSA